MTVRKRIWLVAGAAVLGGLFFVALWPFMVGGSRMEAFCRSLPKGAQLAQVRDIAGQNGYRVTPPDKDGRVLVHEPRSFGRFVCEARIEEGRLVSSRYQSND